jgi:hypothetical protein
MPMVVVFATALWTSTTACNMVKKKRQAKIQKVMREFAEGRLKSGGSGKKVTNPKQAYAIANSEANALKAAKGGRLCRGYGAARMPKNGVA